MLGTVFFCVYKVQYNTNTMANSGNDKEDSVIKPGRKGERKVIPTEKDRQYQVTLKKDRYDEMYQCLSELMTVVWKVISSSGSPQLVYDDYKR